jgi:hypothetical protein
MTPAAIAAKNRSLQLSQQHLRLTIAVNSERDKKEHSTNNR